MNSHRTPPLKPPRPSSTIHFTNDIHGSKTIHYGNHASPSIERPARGNVPNPAPVDLEDSLDIPSQAEAAMIPHANGMENTAVTFYRNDPIHLTPIPVSLPATPPAPLVISTPFVQPDGLAERFAFGPPRAFKIGLWLLFQTEILFVGMGSLPLTPLLATGLLFFLPHLLGPIVARRQARKIESAWQETRQALPEHASSHTLPQRREGVAGTLALRGEELSRKIAAASEEEFPEMENILRKISPESREFAAGMQSLIGIFLRRNYGFFEYHPNHRSAAAVELFFKILADVEMNAFLARAVLKTLRFFHLRRYLIEYSVDSALNFSTVLEKIQSLLPAEDPQLLWVKKAYRLLPMGSRQ